MKAGADFEKAADASVKLDLARGRVGDLREDLQEGAFAGAVAADDADDFAFLNVEGDVAQSPERLAALVRPDRLRKRSKGAVIAFVTISRKVVPPTSPLPSWYSLPILRTRMAADITLNHGGREYIPGSS